MIFLIRAEARLITTFFLTSRSAATRVICGQALYTLARLAAFAPKLWLLSLLPYIDKYLFGSSPFSALRPVRRTYYTLLLFVNPFLKKISKKFKGVLSREFYHLYGIIFQRNYQPLRPKAGPKYVGLEFSAFSAA